MIGLDLLRFLAIVLVLGRHMEIPPDAWHSPFRKLFVAWKDNGGLGVDLFFVLSGFLVSGLLFREYIKLGDISVTRFYAQRAWKIYPSFYVLIAFTYFYYLYVIGYKIPVGVMFSELFFLQSYFRGAWNQTWSLAVEEHFYIALPLVLLFLARRNKGEINPFRSVPLLVTVSAVVILALRIINFCFRTEDAAYVTYYKMVFPTHLRIDALLMGVMIAYAYHFHDEWFQQFFRPRRYLMILIGLVALISSFWLPPYQGFYTLTFGFAQFYLGSAALLIGVLMCQVPQNAITKSLATLGAFSYSIYLWHMALMIWAVPHLASWGFGWGTRTAIYLAGAFVIGIPMAKLLELPVLRIRDRWYPSRVGNLVRPDRCQSPETSVFGAAA